MTQKNPTRRELRELEDKIRHLLSDRSCTIGDRRGGIVFSIRATRIGQEKGESVTIEEINRNLDNIDGINLGNIKKTYRRRAELPDPSKPAWAEVNRGPSSQRRVNLRLDETVFQLVEEAAKRRGMNRTSWMTEACLRLAREQGLEIPEELQPILDEPT